MAIKKIIKKEGIKKDGEEMKKEEIIEEVVSDMDVVNKEEAKTKKTSKSKKQYLSGEWVKTEWGWRWEGETDEDGRPIMRKECDSAEMYHIDKPSWVYEEGEGKDIKQYDVWCIRFKRTGEEIYAYKKDGKLNQVKFVKKPFDLANRLYITGHAYQQKGKEGWGGGEE